MPGNQEQQRRHKDSFGRSHDTSGRTADFTGNVSMVSGILRAGEPDLILWLDFFGPFAAWTMVFIRFDGGNEHSFGIRNGCSRRVIRAGMS